MGRWSQRRMRSTAPPTIATPPVVLPELLGVQGIGGGHVLTTWSLPVTFTNDFSVAGLSVNGPVPFSGSQAGASSIDLDIGSDPTPGDPWTLSAQPSWVVESVTFPSSGVTT